MSLTFKRIRTSIILLLALYGLVMLGVLIAQQFELLTVRGSVDPRTSLFSLTSDQLRDNALPRVRAGNIAEASELTTQISTPSHILCQIMILSREYPAAGNRVYSAFESSDDTKLASDMLLAVASSQPDLQKKFDLCANYTDSNPGSTQTDSFVWMQSDEWAVLREALRQDESAINRAARDANISPRLLIAPIIGEQLRFYTSARASFKSYFEPLKLFAHLSKFSFGVAGLKPQTAERIEQNLINPDSPFYPGQQYEHLLDYTDSQDPDTERINRITDAKNHYWSYLYVALYLKQFESQWRNAGHPIDGRPDILATLYNLGHNRSIPKPDPSAGGAPITINEIEYSFGGLAYDWYWSGELQELFAF